MLSASHKKNGSRRHKTCVSLAHGPYPSLLTTRRGNRAGKAKQAAWSATTDCFFGNITYWGPKVEDFFFDKGAGRKPDLLVVVESHLRGSKLDRALCTIHRYGYTTTASPAAESDVSLDGTHGGAIAAAPKRTHTTPLWDDTPIKFGWQSNHHQTVAIQIAFQGAM